MSDEDRDWDGTGPDGVWGDFHRLVNMSAPELREWLEETSEAVETYPDEPDVDLRMLGERTLEIMGKRRVEVTDADVEVMAEVVDEIGELLENRPQEPAARGAWRDMLMTLGHDPIGDEGDDGSDI